ncbi:MAG: hypothetical protein M3P18_14490 [Actinomycetota bacterium]|nr:hypothetical protein [Actinomycetota bacterium]
MNRCALAALVLAMGGTLATAGTTMAAFQIVHMSATSGELGAVVTMQVDASHLIGGSHQSQVFLIPQNAYEASPEPARCDEIPGATVVGDLRWHAASVEFQDNTYPGFVGTGSFTVPDVETGIYVVSGILDDPYTGCHVFALFGVGMDLPDTAMADTGPSGSILSLVGFALLGASVLLARDTRRHRTPRRYPPQ